MAKGPEADGRKDGRGRKNGGRKKESPTIIRSSSGLLSFSFFFFLFPPFFFLSIASRQWASSIVMSLLLDVSVRFVSVRVLPLKNTHCKSMHFLMYYACPVSIFIPVNGMQQKPSHKEAMICMCSQCSLRDYVLHRQTQANYE